MGALLVYWQLQPPTVAPNRYCDTTTTTRWCDPTPTDRACTISTTSSPSCVPAVGAARMSLVGTVGQRNRASVAQARADTSQDAVTRAAAPGVGRSRSRVVDVEGRC